MGTVRERRRAEFEAKQRKERPALIAKKAIKPLVVVLLIVGVGTAFYVANEAQPDCPGHWHATQAVFIDGSRVNFPQPPYNHQGEGGQLPGVMHMHQGNQEQLHFEPAAPRCRGVEDTMQLMDVNLEPGKLTLSGAHSSGPHGGTYEDDGNETVRVFMQKSGEDLREVGIKSILDYQLANGEKMIITYGQYTNPEIENMMDSVGWPAGFDPKHEDET